MGFLIKINRKRKARLMKRNLEHAGENTVKILVMKNEINHRCSRD